MEAKNAELLALQRIDETSVRLQKQGKYLEALECMERGLVLRQHFFGANSDEVWGACKTVGEMCNLLAMTYLQQEDFPMVLELLKKAEILTERDQQGKAVTFNNLACYYRRQGKLHAALTYLQKAVRIEHQLREVENKADTHLNLCAVLSQLGRHAGALEHAQTALIMLQEELFSNPMVGASGETVAKADRVAVLAIAYHNIGVEQEFLRKYEMSIQSYSKGVNIGEKHLGASHGITVTLRNSLLAAKRALAKKLNQNAVVPLSNPRKPRRAKARKQEKYSPSARDEERWQTIKAAYGDIPGIPDIRAAPAEAVGVYQVVDVAETSVFSPSEDAFPDERPESMAKIAAEINPPPTAEQAKIPNTTESVSESNQSNSTGNEDSSKIDQEQKVAGDSNENAGNSKEVPDRSITNMPAEPLVTDLTAEQRDMLTPRVIEEMVNDEANNTPANIPSESKADDPTSKQPQDNLVSSKFKDTEKQGDVIQDDAVSEPEGKIADKVEEQDASLLVLENEADDDEPEAKVELECEGKSNELEVVEGKHSGEDEEAKQVDVDAASQDESKVQEDDKESTRESKESEESKVPEESKEPEESKTDSVDSDTRKETSEISKPVGQTETKVSDDDDKNIAENKEPELDQSNNIIQSEKSEHKEPKVDQSNNIIQSENKESEGTDSSTAVQPDSSSVVNEMSNVASTGEENAGIESNDKAQESKDETTDVPDATSNADLLDSENVEDVEVSDNKKEEVPAKQVESVEQAVGKDTETVPSDTSAEAKIDPSLAENIEESSAAA